MTTKLILKAISGHADMVRLLIAAGAAVDIQNKYGNTGLLEAIANGHPEVVNLLMAAGGEA